METNKITDGEKQNNRFKAPTSIFLISLMFCMVIFMLSFASATITTTLNSPSDASTQLNRLVQFNATGSTTYPSYLINMSLYTNETGSWALKNTTSTTANYDFSLTRGSDSTESSTVRAGLSFTVQQNGSIVNVTKSSSSNADRAYLYVASDADSGNLLATATFSGDTATFNYEINTTATYFVLAGLNSGGSYTRTYASTSYPQSNSQISVNGFVLLDSGGLQTTSYRNIVGIFTTQTLNQSTQVYNNTYNSGQTIKWNYLTCDNSSACTFGTNRTFSIDSSEPVIYTPQPTTLVDYGKLGGNLTLQTRATDSNLDSCWYNYNFTNTTITGCQSGVFNLTNITLTTQKNLTVYANDSAGNLGIETITWDYKVFENSQTYSSTTLEGATESFLVNLTLNSSYRITTGYLNYDGTPYAATISINGNNYLLRSLNIPDVSSEVNKTFFWIINLDDDSQVNTTSLNQTVGNLGVDDCSSYTYQLFNISMYDEDTQAFLSGVSQNTYIKVSFTIKTLNSGLTLLNYSKFYNQTNPARLCLQSDLGGSSYRLDGVVEYSSSGRFQEYYHFQNYTLTNSSDNFTVSLYNLNSSEGTEFKITYKDSNFVPVSGAVLNIQRKYVAEGLFKTTEIPKTGAEGYTIGHLVRNDVIYNIIVMKDGEVLATFEEVVADCQNPLLSSCEINLNSYGSSSLPTDFTNYKDISFSGPTYNSTTRVINSIFVIPSGETSTVQLNVTLFDNLGNTSVCSDSLYSSGGQLSCTVPSNFGNATVIATLYKDGDVVGRAIIKLKQDPKDIYGGAIIVIALLVFLTIAGFGASSDSPMYMGITLVIGSIILVAMNIIYTPSILGVGATILWFIICVILILIKGSNRQ